ncbi:uncharacterized protein LY89DRAFT_217775 [Mollisia scopiformis]|uniref:Uncharacterized protein n=1 Tax=Mollisia scopiformis TaxID=149040 RepID=A0A194WWL4_MOLSC|nr:uncharacterized protein LY89DRAFT_217775 [Mollisia scopiformis]KUJ11972.1 hypothetical protein LY89DRAFT_217775 [Mollisia scopiformis]
MELRLMVYTCSIWLGNIKYDAFSEPFVPQVFEDGGIQWTSWHSSPTGFTHPWILESKTAPVGFTRPHSMSGDPEGSTDLLEFNPDGVLTSNGANKFVGCQTEEQLKKNNRTYQIWWQGAGPVPGVECTSIVVLYKMVDFDWIG